MTFRQARQKRKAFTLIELLVVVAIIGLLAAILFPVFARARENARRASCMSNLKQLDVGFQQYTQDFDEKMPNGIEDTIGLGTGWGGKLYPYVKSSQIFQCPSNGVKPIAGYDFSNGYAYNIAIPYKFASAADAGINCAIVKFNSPAKTVVLLETAAHWARLDSGLEDCVANTKRCTPITPGFAGRMFIKNVSSVNNAGSFETGCLGRRTCTVGYGGARFLSEEGRHLGGANYLLADGHVKWYKGEKVSSGYAALLPGDPQENATTCTGCRAAGTENSSDSFAVTFSPI